MSEKDVDGVHIILDGEENVLVPTFAAAKAISAQFGGIQPALEKVSNLDIQTITDILALGLGYFPPRNPPKDFAERVYQTGFLSPDNLLATKCTTFLVMLAGGGKLPVDDDDQEDKKPVDPQ